MREVSNYSKKNSCEIQIIFSLIYGYTDFGFLIRIYWEDKIGLKIIFLIWKLLLFNLSIF